MNNRDLFNPDGSKRRFVHPPPPLPPLPPTNCQQPPPNSQRSAQPYSHTTPFGCSQVQRTGNHVITPQIDYRNRMMVQQSTQQQYSMDALIPSGSHEMRIPAPVQTTSVPHPSPQPTPPPPVLTPQPVPFPHSSAKNLGKMVLPSVQNEQVKTNEKLEESGEMSAHQLSASAAQNYKALGQALSIMTSSLKNDKDKLARYHEVNNKLMAQTRVQNEQIQSLQEEVTSLNNNMEEIRAESAKEVERARADKVAWRNNCVTFNQKNKTLQNELVSKDGTIESLKKTISDNNTKITQLGLEVLDVKSSEEKLKNQLEERENQINSLKKKVSEKEMKICDMKKSEKEFNEKLQIENKKFQSLQEEFNEKSMQLKNLKWDLLQINTQKKDLENKIGDFEKKEKANKSAAKKLEAERNSLKSENEELKVKITERNNEISRISSELEKEKQENQTKNQVLEQKNKKIYRLKEEVKFFKSRNDELRKKVYEQVDQIFENHSQTQFKREGSPSSAEEETDEPLSMAVAVNKNNENDTHNGSGNEEEQLEYHVAAPGEKRKFSAGKYSPEKKTRRDANCSSDNDQTLVLPKVIISLPRIHQRDVNGRDAEKRVVSSPSNVNNIPSTSDRQQRSKSDSKQSRK